MPKQLLQMWNSAIKQGTDAGRCSELAQAQALVCSCSICNQAYDELCAGGIADKALHVNDTSGNDKNDFDANYAFQHMMS